MTDDTVPVIEIPGATAEPAAHVQALIGTLGDRDPLEVDEGVCQLNGVTVWCRLGPAG
jgi:hypothetical protein